MKKLWFAVIAALAILLGADRSVVAQGVAPGSVVQAPNGQAYMVVPDDSGPLASPVGYSGSMATGSNSKGCTDGCCGKSNCDSCCPQGWCDRFFAYGGLMYLRSRNSELVYAMPVTGPINPNNASSNAPAGAVRVLDQDYSAGFFVGFGKYLDECSSIGFQYNQFESNTRDDFALPGGGPFIRSLVSIPAASSADVDGLSSFGSHSIRYKMGDIDYRNLFAYDHDYRLNFVAGLRMVQLNQNFDGRFTQLGTVRNTTDIDFYGAGLKLGLEGERDVRRGFQVYGKGYVSFVPGEFRNDYTQTSGTQSATNVNASWSGGRIVTMADLELGGSWVSACGNLRLSAGYLLSSWSNVVQTRDWIRAAQTTDFTSSFNRMNSTMTWDGLMFRIEGRF